RPSPSYLWCPPPGRLVHTRPKSASIGSRVAARSSARSGFDAHAVDELHPPPWNQSTASPRPDPASIAAAARFSEMDTTRPPVAEAMADASVGAFSAAALPPAPAWRSPYGTSRAPESCVHDTSCWPARSHHWLLMI